MTSPPRPLSRRDFLRRASASTAGVVLAGSFGGVLAACAEDQGPRFRPEDATLRARPGTPTGTVTAGVHPLGLASGRDGLLYVPASYDPAVASPLIVLLHGAGRSSAEWASAPLGTLFEPSATIAVIPDSRGATWDIPLSGGFGPDVRFIDDALAYAFAHCRVAPARVALAGFSDGGTYSLSLGIPNGDLFGHVLAFSPGFTSIPFIRGTPRVFESHGRQDPILPIDETSRTIVPSLRARGLDVTYVEFDGGHEVPMEVAEQAVGWFLS